ncbi:hypothetical protein DMB66_53825 [Actinoplanes sp. ATCC 53533]|uniref:hypothetical protein n=1 Tax=Actinoplanes sp. ATCC 53533 TaxID=1288362 RepID=UPI000F77FB86|nr:hypothetical protein [Actinoplanes sp. ATCC 53533]RSM43093.1 hypothetical protein DMB66_53825 [Actinoplanes sp. ATCC 53533]
MATVARLLPRHWDGRRLLQFLTGLALIALAFAVPALQDPADQPAESPVTIVTTVDTPFPAGLPVIDAPAEPDLSTNKTNLALAQEGHTAGSTTPTTPGSDPAAGSDPGSPPAGAEPASGTPAAAGADPASGSPAAAGTDPGFPAAGPRSEAEAAARNAAALQGAQAGGYGPGSTGPSAVPGDTGLPAQAWNGGRRICFEGRAAGSGAQGAHGERGPPRI